MSTKPTTAPGSGQPPQRDTAQDLSRRKLLTLIGWGGFLASMGGAAFGTFRFMFPEILYEPPTVFKIGKPADYGMGVTDTLKKERQIWVVKNERGLYVLVAICRHLGCTPNWFQDQQRFRCPCHGSIYDIFGNVRGGPAPRTLWRAAVSLDPVDGQVQVNFIQRQDPDPKSTPEGLTVLEEPREVAPFFIKL